MPAYRMYLSFGTTSATNANQDFCCDLQTLVNNFADRKMVRSRSAAVWNSSALVFESSLVAFIGLMVIWHIGATMERLKGSEVSMDSARWIGVDADRQQLSVDMLIVHNAGIIYSMTL